MDLSLPERRIVRVRHDLQLREVQVVSAQPLGNGFIGVTFGGDSLVNFVSLSFDDHVKFMFPGPEGERVMRDYTPTRYDAARRELTLEFALHAQGAASDWARQAQPGQRVTLGGPKGSMIIPVDYDWHLLAGDASALPSIHRRVQELPATTRAIVLVQVDSDTDIRPLHSAAALQVQWVHDEVTWLAALHALELPAGQGFAWCAGEARVMAQARTALLEHHALSRTQLRVAAYWKRGAADFHERLEG